MATSEELTSTSNPYLDFHRKFVCEHPGHLSAVFDPKLSDDIRSEMYAALDISVAMVGRLRLEADSRLQLLQVLRNTRGQFQMSALCK